MIKLWGIIITLAVYALCLYLRKYKYLRKAPPVLVASAVLIFILLIGHLEYASYNQSAGWITFLLGPATIALAWPLSQNLGLLAKNKRAVYCGLLLSSVLTIVLIFAFGKLMGVDWAVITSMMPKSVTTPIAVEISKDLGGISELTVFIVMLSGIFGAVFGHALLKLLKVRSDITIGLSIGSTSHVLGTASCMERKRERQTAMSTMSLIVTGILTAFIAPLLIKILHG